MGGRAFPVLVRRALLPVGLLLVSGWFLQHALFGTSGLVALEDIRAERDALLAERRGLAARKADIEARLALLDPRGADPDYAEELVRRHLGVVRPDEVVIPLTPEPRRPGAG